MLQGVLIHCSDCLNETMRGCLETPSFILNNSGQSFRLGIMLHFSRAPAELINLVSIHGSLPPELGCAGLFAAS